MPNRLCIECGSSRLSGAERLEGARIVVVVQGLCTSHTSAFSRHAYEIGVEAVIAMAA